MGSTCFLIFISLCLFAQSSSQTTSSGDGTIKYLVDSEGGKSCDEVCQAQGFVCKSTDHGLPSNVVPTFKKAGVDCQFDNFDTSKDDWRFSADPKYAIGGIDDGICRGFKKVPSEIKCDPKPAANYGRLCPCIVAQTTTEQPTTAAQTTAAQTTTEQPTTATQTTAAATSTAQSEPPTTASQSTLVAPQSDGLTVRCSSESIVAILDLKKFPNMDTTTMTLEESSCKPTHVNDTHAIIDTPLDDCGTTHNSTEDYLHYYNNIKISRRKKNSSSRAIITRDHEAIFPIQCSYDRKTVLSVVSFSPRKKFVYTRASDYGNFTFMMDMYKSDNYQEAYDEYPVIVKLGQRLYLEVKAESKDSSLVLFAQKCLATPTNDVNDKKYYNFIEKGCGTDKTLLYDYNNQSSFQRFSIDSFRFLSGAADRVHLHCEVVVCRKSDTDSLCAKGCDKGKNSRKRRASVGNQPREVLTVGPMDFVQVQTASGFVAGPVSVTTVASIAVTLGLLALVLIATVVIIYRRRQSPRGCKPVLLVQE